ncbi:hypothetical protein [Haloquadratum walsbyi]|jgi:hypothetical protein|uniref:Uncharacterized protein n=1 Tax=Haloquadratum walsbyi J07HQW2 TaxID=1238425 RepID=U1PTK3_9EURY|nr:hypothetical protein [Haloquadratum walsbyi]ERG97132.1 MAG: hypothetical protein J07HQW2_03618 [Haloquadratum walsbyi J07HQW2]
MGSALEQAESEPSTGIVGSKLEMTVIGLLTITAITHLYAGVNQAIIPPLLLAGLGFLGGIGLYIRGTRRHLLTIAAIPYTAVQIPLWFVIKSGNFTPLGYLDKAVQVLLIIALVVLVFRQRK